MVFIALPFVPLRRAFSILLLVAGTALLASAQPKGYKALFNGRDLNGWEIRGDGQWTVIDGGVLVGQRDYDSKSLAPGKKFTSEVEFQQWLNHQAWLYTTEEFSEYDLHVEFWTKNHGNSGISLHDKSRAEAAIAFPPNFLKTPARVAYEIQINNNYPDPHPTGSIYSFMDAPKDSLKTNQWNTMDIRVRKTEIVVQLNGREVARTVPDPKRASSGPIGLQLHDQFSVIHFKNIWIRVAGQ
jgi:hypothetical protein